MSDLPVTQPSTTARSAPGAPDDTFPPNYSPLVPDENDPTKKRLGKTFEGGMGRVCEAHDVRLDRVVAVKLLKDEFSANSSEAALFQAEMRLTAQLQHPGIPPIHEAGLMANGRPFMVMKFIKGKNLAEMLADYAARGCRAAELPNLLDVFESVVETVAYAHDRGVNHLDLKPGNIMVGKFREVQVLDWGIASVAGAPNADNDDGQRTVIRRPIELQSESASDWVSERYAAPEKALKRAKVKVGPPTDVFALGAILCELLTGKPVYEPPDVRMKAVGWDVELAFERLTMCGADPELIAVTKKCLAQRPEERYANAQALVEELAKWRGAVAERAKAAEREAARRQKAEQQERENQLKSSFEELVFGVHRKLARQAGTHDLQQTLLRVARDGLQQFARTAEHSGGTVGALIWAHFQLGDVLVELNDVIGAQREFEAAHAVARQQSERAPTDVQSQRNLSVSFNKLGDVAVRRGQLEDAHELYTRGLQIAEKLTEASPTDASLQRDLSVSYNRLSDVLLRLRNPELARGYSERALAVARKQTPELAPGPITGAESEAVRDLSVSIEKLGDVLRHLNDGPGAGAHYAESLDLRERLAAGDPDNVQARRDLGVSLGKLGGVRFNGLGEANKRGALDYFRKAFDVFKTIAEAEPNDSEAQRDYSVGYNQLGDALAALGNREEAIAQYERAIEIRRALSASQPGDIQTQRDLIVSLFKLGSLRQDSKDLTRAIGHYQEGLNLIRASGHPNQFAEENALFETRLAICKFHLKKNAPV